MNMPRKHIAQLGLATGSGSRHDDVTAGDRGYPRPLLRRAGWTSLDGTWQLAIDGDGSIRNVADVRFDREIEVPFTPETARSGVADTGLYRALWYRREISVAPPKVEERVLLHFGAVDYVATVWVNGAFAVRHEGGYSPFSADITDLLVDRSTQEIVVRVEDDPADLAKPRGKQDWQLEPHSIWYPRTTGIWQTVWLERVNAAHVSWLRWTPDLPRWAITMDARITAPEGKRYWLSVRLHVGDVLFAEDRYSVVAGEVHRRVGLSDPGIDDFRNEFLWSPSRPTLFDVEIALLDEAGNVLDSVASYTALRAFAVDGNRFVLNGRPYPLRMVLDQGYWPETGLTAPDDAALRRDVELAKAMGFNGVRKHQKIEDPRYLYWADRLGLLVWGEMPSAYRFTERSVERLTQQWLEAIRRDTSHPCVIAWVPFNESWGVPNLPDSKPERHYVEALYHLTRTIDPTRPVVGNDGWESVATDILGIHDYDESAERILERYATPDLLPKILKSERPGGRALVFDGRDMTSHPVVLSEFGGIAVRAKATGYGAHDAQTEWGYSSSADEEELARRYLALLEAVRSCELFAGFCYTQFADTYQEANGLLRADRTPKFPLEEIAAATTGVQAKAVVPAPISVAELARTERGGGRA